MMDTAQKLGVRVSSITPIAQGIKAFELRRANSSPLTPFTAGDHIDLEMPENIMRSYSLMNSQFEREGYVTVLHSSPTSHCDSSCMHEVVQPGHQLTVSEPRNNLELTEDESHSVLIHGGIGITPLWSMLQRLRDLGRGWNFYYNVRTRGCAAMLVQFEALEHRPTLWLNDQNGDKLLDLEAIVRNSPAGSHFYCCGPLPMLEVLRQVKRDIPTERIDFKYFLSSTAPKASGVFMVVLALSGREAWVLSNTCNIGALSEQSIEVRHACREGICGACEKTLLEGIYEHRHPTLGESERAANCTMMICCSVAKNARLMLNL